MNHPLTITQQINIHASRLRVWEGLSDLANHHHWNPTLRVEAAPAHLGVGTSAQLLAAPGTSNERAFGHEPHDP